MTSSRRHFTPTPTPPQKADAVRRHVAGKEAVSALGEELGVQPSQIHLWVKQVLDQAERAFERSGGGRSASSRAENAKDQKIARLEQKLVAKNEVVAELVEAHVLLKKELGEL